MGAGWLAAALDLVEQALGQVQFGRLEPVGLVLLHGDADAIARGSGLARLLLHGRAPIGIHVADVHIEAQALQARREVRLRVVLPQPGIAADRGEVSILMVPAICPPVDSLMVALPIYERS